MIAGGGCIKAPDTTGDTYGDVVVVRNVPPDRRQRYGDVVVARNVSPDRRCGGCA